MLYHTFCLHDHIGFVMREHFEFRSPFKELSGQTYQSCLQKLNANRIPYCNLTPDQKYLHDLSVLPGYAFSVYRLRLGLSRLKPRGGKMLASSRLEKYCQEISMNAYNFRERIKILEGSVCNIISGDLIQRKIKFKIGDLIKCFDRNNKQVLRHRNFIVHGPEGRKDEFADVKLWATHAVLRDELWADYIHAFEEAKSKWRSLTQTLLASMDTTNAEIKLLNENLLSIRAYSFL